MIKNKIISTRGTNIRKGFKKTNIYMPYKPPNMSVFVTKLRGTRQQEEVWVNIFYWLCLYPYMKITTKMSCYTMMFMPTHLEGLQDMREKYEAMILG